MFLEEAERHWALFCITAKLPVRLPRWVKMRTAAGKTGLPVCLRFRTWTNIPDQSEWGNDSAGESPRPGSITRILTAQASTNRHDRSFGVPVYVCMVCITLRIFRRIHFESAWERVTEAVQTCGVLAHLTRGLNSFSFLLATL